MSQAGIFYVCDSLVGLIVQKDTIKTYEPSAGSGELLIQARDLIVFMARNDAYLDRCQDGAMIFENPPMSGLNNQQPLSS